MAFNLKVNERDAKPLVAEQEIVDGIISGIRQGSTILPLMTKLPDATSDTAVITALDALPIAYFVDEGIANGRKETTNAGWKNIKLHMAEIAVIVPIKQNLLNDAKYNIFGQMRPLLIEQAYKLVDEAIILGKNKPALWRTGLIESIINAGKNVAPSTNNTYTQISDAMTQVETSGYDVNGILGGVALKGEFRKGLVDTTGQPLANSEVTELPRAYAKNGAWDNALAKFIVGDFSQAVYSIRQDVTFDVFDTGVINDESGNIIFNLMQDDMVALRMTFRMTWGIPNPINVLDSSDTRFPFALVGPSSAPTTYNVTFTITDTQSTPAPIAGVKVILGEQVKKTNASGQAVFKSLGNAEYAYVASKAGLKTDAGTVTVASANKSVAITMVTEQESEQCLQIITITLVFLKAQR